METATRGRNEEGEKDTQGEIEKKRCVDNLWVSLLLNVQECNHLCVCIININMY